MLKTGTKVRTIGVFTVAEVQEEFVELDPFEKGTEDSLVKYEDEGTIEVTSEGKEKEFDGFQKGDFFALTGIYEIVRSNEFFSKVKIGDQLISLPNHKLIEA